MECFSKYTLVERVDKATDAVSLEGLEVDNRLDTCG